MIRAVQLYTFLNYCDESPLEKEVLECGAGVLGVREPLLVRFFECGYKTHGIEISEERLEAARTFCKERNIALHLSPGDMRKLPFEDESLSFVYSYNAIFHMKKEDIGIAMREIERVLKKKGRCFVNFLSIDDGAFGEGEPLGKGEFLQDEGSEKTIHTYYEDDEPDMYFKNFTILHKEKRIGDLLRNGRKERRAYLDYIAEKR